MKNKYPIVHIITICAIVFCSGLILKLKKQDTKNKSTIQDLQSSLFFTKESLINHIALSSMQNRELALYLENSGIQINKPLLIYRYAANMCKNCTDLDLSILSESFDSLTKSRLLILPAYHPNRDSQVQLNYELEHFSYINTDEKTLPFPTDSSGVSHRFFAVIDSLGNLTDIFFPDKNIPELTTEYLERFKIHHLLY